eukprot:GEMP01054110.1.p1 GENE.GEMP01054110.1~~GEMP01054110.1.p1  ORF type:complete len:357 (+),score=82.23 GEMP01054110.1:87-1157(+)
MAMQQIVEILQRQQQREKERDASLAEPALTLLRAAIRDKNQDLCRLRANFSSAKEYTLRNMARAITPMRKRRKLRQGVEHKPAQMIQHAQNASRRRITDDPHMQRLRSEKQTLFELWQDAEIRLHSKPDANEKSPVSGKDAHARPKAVVSSSDIVGSAAKTILLSSEEAGLDDLSGPIANNVLKAVVTELREKEKQLNNGIIERDQIMQRFMRNPPDSWLKWLFKERIALAGRSSNAANHVTYEDQKIMPIFKEEAELLDHMECYIGNADTTLERENSTLKGRIGDLEESVNSLKACISKQEQKITKLQKMLLQDSYETSTKGDSRAVARNEKSKATIDDDDAYPRALTRHTRDKW